MQVDTSPEIRNIQAHPHAFNDISTLLINLLWRKFTQYMHDILQWNDIQSRDVKILEKCEYWSTFLALLPRCGSDVIWRHIALPPLKPCSL